MSNKYFGAGLPDMLENETYGDYRKRCNLPYVYTPFFPGGETQVDWQVKLQSQFPTISFYPYDGLQVSKGMEMVFVIFEDESQITEMARERIVRHCSDYGREHAEKAVPTVEQLRVLYATAKEQHANH